MTAYLSCDKDEDLEDVTDEETRFVLKHPLSAKLYLTNNSAFNDNQFDSYTVYLRTDLKDGNFENLVKGLGKIGYDNDVAYATAVKLSEDKIYEGFLKIPANKAENVESIKE